MSAFFSEEDERELKENTPNHAFYLSLIVNFKGKYVARICVMSKREVVGNSWIRYCNIIGKENSHKVTVKSTEDVVYAVDLDIEVEEANNPFLKEINKIYIRKEREEAERRKNQYRGGYGGYYQSQFPSTTRQADQLAMWPEDDYTNASNNDLVDVPDFDEMEDKARDLLFKIICQDSSRTGYLPSLIMKTDLSWNTSTDTEKKLFFDNTAASFQSCYMSVFPDDTAMTFFDEVMDSIADLLATYSTAHEFASDLAEELETYSITAK